MENITCLYKFIFLISQNFIFYYKANIIHNYNVETGVNQDNNISPKRQEIYSKKNRINNNKIITNYRARENKVNTLININIHNEVQNKNGESPNNVQLSKTNSMFNIPNKNIDRIVVPTFLPVRYNGKEISFLVRKRLLQGKGYDIEKINDQFHELTEKHEQIQRNLSDKLLRNIRRLEYAFNNINVTSYPYELDSNTSISLTKYNDCNNKLLKEIYELTKAKQKTR